MNKHLTEEMIIAFQLDDLSPQEKQNMTKHLLECKQCTILKAELDELYDVWENPPEMKVSEDFHMKVMSSIQDDLPERTKLHPVISYQKTRWTTAAHLALSAAATFALMYYGVMQDLGSVPYYMLSAIDNTSGLVERVSSEGFFWLENIQLKNMMK